MSKLPLNFLILHSNLSLPALPHSNWQQYHVRFAMTSLYRVSIGVTCSWTSRNHFIQIVLQKEWHETLQSFEVRIISITFLICLHRYCRLRILSPYSFSRAMLNSAVLLTGASFCCHIVDAVVNLVCIPLPYLVLVVFNIRITFLYLRDWVNQYCILDEWHLQKVMIIDLDFPIDSTNNRLCSLKNVMVQ